MIITLCILEFLWNRTCLFAHRYDAELPGRRSRTTACSICHRYRDPDRAIASQFSGKTYCSQLLRSGTAAAPNYGEARAAESRADFIHKLKIALKELNETAIWLRIIQGSFAVDADFLTRLVAENTELCKILVASIQTARRNNKADQG